MAAKRYHYIEHEILRLVLQRPGDPSAGYQISLPELENFLRQTVPDIETQEVVDALKRLRPKYLTLSKWSDEHGRFIEYPTEINDDNRFFHWDRIRLQRTPESDPYLQELAALFPVPESEPPKKPIGFVP